MLDSDDHRVLARRLDLFHFREEAPGMVFWHPNGYALYRQLENAIRSQIASEGYSEIRTPQILRKAIWEASGHWEHFRGGMFEVADQSEPAAVKPVSCPGHVCVFGHRIPSYRELPLKLAEFGVVHRDEPSGTLHGLLRLRQFTQDDGHIFCSEAQAEAEILAFCRGVLPFYRKFGFEEISVAFATRPEQRAGDEAAWDRSEQALRNVLARLGWAYAEQPGGGAFYGPKLEFVLKDRLGREYSCGTIQFDLVMPRRFDIRYVDASGSREHPVMLHRALCGSLERFLGMVLEHHGANLPGWLCPVQVVVAPVAAAHAAFASEAAEQLRREGLRVRLDDRGETLSRRIAEAHEACVPYVAVVGAREVESRALAVRERDGSQSAGALERVVERLAGACRSPFHLDESSK